MGDVETASTLTLVAGILQIVFSIILIFIGGIMALLFLPLLMDPYFMMIMGYFLMIFMIYPIMGVIGLIFGIIWLNWRQSPGAHKTGLIVSGVLGMLMVGFVPGLLALIAGAIVPSSSEYRGYVPPPRPTVRVVSRCPSCGVETAGKDDRFCWSCGAAL